jgi:hypothetical protein
MPKRSNEFQRLVAMLTMLQSDGATVHESVEVMELASQELREVDIVALGKVAGHQSTVFTECRDWKRPQDVQWGRASPYEVRRLRRQREDSRLFQRIYEGGAGKSCSRGIKTITTGEVTAEFVGKVVNSAHHAEYWHWVTLVQKAVVVITREGVVQHQELPGNVPVCMKTVRKSRCSRIS